jgi:tetrapyrrole methylase family protein/MazG family protein
VGEKMNHKITVVGLGPGSKDYLTVGALEKLKNHQNIILRTEKHPVVDFLKSEGIHFESFDFLYDSSDNFDDVYSTIVGQLLKRVEKEDILYAVPGSPFVAEYTVQMLITEEANTKKFYLEFIPSVSFIEAIFHTLKIDPIKGFKIINGLELDQQFYNIDTDMVITQVYNQWIASDIKLKLMDYYPDEYPVIVIRGAGIPTKEKVATIKLYELDRIPWLDHLTSIYVPKVEETLVKKYTMNNLLKIMEKLRGKNGCPWDAQQTHESLMPHLIEETYEVLEALELKDNVLLEEELGDLLLQIVFHTLLASETGDFDMGDVISGICKKLIHRHPHVFGEAKIDSASDVLKNWEEIKNQEKEVKTYTDALRRIPKHLPALMKSDKVQRKAANIGFDWDTVEEAIEKVREEFAEFLEVYQTNQTERITEEIGDLIFAMVNVARFLNIHPELAVNQTIEKFIDRFQFMETMANHKGVDLKEMTLKEMDALWEKAKIHKNKKNK